MAESMEYTLGRIEGKLDLILRLREEQKADIAEARKEAKVESSDLCNRVEKLENQRAQVIGACAVLSAIVALIIHFI